MQRNGHNGSVWAGLCALGILGCGQGDATATDEAAIQGGQAESGFPAVGMVNINGSFNCSGSLIAPDVVLTAAHCLGSGMSFTSNGVTHAVVAQLAHPTKDLALLQLGRMDFQPLEVSNSPPPAPGTVCTGIGYGWHNEANGTVTSGAKRSCTEAVDSADATTVAVHMVTGVADHGDSGGPLLCGNRISAVVHNHTDGDFPAHTHENYATIDPQWIASTVASWRAAAFPLTCQRASDDYGISSGITWGFAPFDVQVFWTVNGCTTHPSSPDACQRASDIYGIAAGVTWGFAPSNVRTWWTANNCNAAPLHTIDVCQRASNQFGIVANTTFGSAPSEVQSWWTTSGCNRIPTTTSACQKASDLFGIVPFVSFGSAPGDVQSFWVSNGCSTSPITPDTCQLASDTYAIAAGVSFGFAPPDVQTWWVNAGCNTQPSSGNACQRASELYGIAAGITWGFAPPAVQTWWTQHGCNTQPSSQDTCQRASDTYGIAAGVTFGIAPADVRTWWTSHGCNTQPR